jgi:excisionase family DNA binding protein
MASTPVKQHELFSTKTEGIGRPKGREKRRYVRIPAAVGHCEHLLTVPEVAERCRLSVRQMWRHIEENRLRVVRIGRSVRIRPSDLERFLRGEWE